MAASSTTIPPATATSPTVAAPTATGGGTDWTVQVADTVDSVVGAVRDRSVRPLTLVAKSVVYGVIVAVVGVAVLCLGAVAAVRALNIALRDWASEAIIGGSFSLLGLFFLSRGRSAMRSPEKPKR